MIEDTRPTSEVPYERFFGGIRPDFGFSRIRVPKNFTGTPKIVICVVFFLLLFYVRLQ